MRIIIGSDHAGYKLKEEIKQMLKKQKHTIEDIGTYSEKIKVDYPDYAFKLAKKIVKDKKAKGILICGTGTGMAIAANRIKGARAAFAYDEYSAIMSRKDNDANILTLRARNFSARKAKKLVQLWLATPFSRAKRHKRRIAKLDKQNA